MRSIIGLCATAFAAIGFLFASVANAQTQSPSAPSSTVPEQKKATTAAIADSKLDAAAAAVKGVSEIRESYEQKLAQAPAAEKERVADEANAALIKAVTDQGLSIDEYTKIIEVAQSDPDVRDKLLKRLK
jgi:hypothetical protein